MSEARTIVAKNINAMMLSQLVTWASTLLLMLFLPRYLGDEDYGRLYFAGSLAAFINLLMDLGLTGYLVKEVSRDHTKAQVLFVNSVALRGVAWVVSFLAAFLYVSISGLYSAETLIIVLIAGVGAFFAGETDLVYRIFQSYERLQYRTVPAILERVFLSVVGVSFLILGYGATTMVTVGLASQILSFLVSGFLLPRVVKLKWHITPGTWTQLLRGGFPFFLAVSLSFIYYRVDVLLLSGLTSDKVVGWYGAPYRLFEALMFFPSIISMVVFPLLARLWQDSKDSHLRATRRILDITLIVSVPVTVLLIACARPIVALMFGLKYYENSVVLLQILAASLPLMYVDFLLGTVLISTDRQRYTPIVAAFALVINVGINLLLIPYFSRTYGNGAIGAAITTGITELCVTGMFIYTIPKGTLDSTNVKLALKSILCGVLMASVTWLIESRIQLWPVSAAIGTMVYFLGLVATKAVTRREWDLALTLLPWTRTSGAGKPRS